MPKVKNSAWVLGCFIAVLAFGVYVSRHPMDFRVYYYGARGVFEGTRPVYGRTSGLGWPMHYRYPPLFLLIFAPFAMLPLAWGAAVWVVLKILVLLPLLKALHSPPRRGGVDAPEAQTGWSDRPNRFAELTTPARLYLRLRPIGLALRATTLLRGEELSRSFLLPFLFIAPYIIEEFRYGNAQFFVFALSAAALLIMRDRPVLSAASLALGISIKVWPLFFVPYLAVRRNWNVVAYTLVFVAVLAALPAFYFGFAGNVNLLGQWFSQEMHTQLSESEIWFPNQSLRGVMMRYLTIVDYSQVPDSNYAQVNILALAPSAVRLIWFALAAAAYCGFLWVAHRRRNTNGWIDHGLAFCLIAVLEPFTQKYALSILLWPAIAAEPFVSKPRFRMLLYCATILVLIQPLTPGANAQRLLQVLGLDFGAAALLTAVMAAACLRDL